jgi:hypothetical protein
MLNQIDTIFLGLTSDSRPLIVLITVYDIRINGYLFFIFNWVLHIVY